MRRELADSSVSELELALLSRGRLWAVRNIAPPEGALCWKSRLLLPAPAETGMARGAEVAAELLAARMTVVAPPLLTTVAPLEP